MCDKTLRESAILKVHERIHTVEKPFRYSKCDKKFARAGTLKIHERIHIPKKPFSCSMCDKTFRESATLLIHERIHTGEKPFSCSKCNNFHIFTIATVLQIISLFHTVLMSISQSIHSCFLDEHTPFLP